MTKQKKVEKATRAEVRKERNPKKVKGVIKEKTGKEKLSKGLELHHIKTVAEGGKTTVKNTRIVTKAKHKQIHKNRRKKGEI